MRHALFCVLTSLVAIAPRLCSQPPALPSQPVTVILDFEQSYPSHVVEEMKREAESILRGSHLSLEWRMRSEVGQQSFVDLVLVTFRGQCSLDAPVTEVLDMQPLAFTHMIGNQVQPFAEVECNRIASLVRPAMSDRDLRLADQRMGQAMARVLAHELMHMLTKSAAHGVAGVAKPALSGGQLLRPVMAMEPEDLDRIQQEFESR
jgi:hypothetical protein